jgi:hypothetical protein
MKKWQERGLAVGISFVCAWVYIWARRVELPMLRAPDGRYTHADADSFMRWHLVERALNGEGARIRWMTEDNAPYGRMNEWTSPMTILGVGLVRTAEAFGGMSRLQALEWAGLWLGPLVGLVSLAALGWLGWHTGGWSLAACWMIAWPVLEDVIQISRFGRTDHLNFHQLVFICIVGGCLASAQQPSFVVGALIGLASAVAMWSAGSELLPALALVAGLAVYEMGWLSEEGERTAFWRGWWIAGLAGTTAAWLFEFWPLVWHGRLEFISLWHVSLWIIGGCLLEWLGRRRSSGRTKLMAVVGAVLSALVIAGASRGFDWRHLHVMQDGRFHRQMAVTTEFGSLAKDGFAGALKKMWWKYGLLPLCALAVVHRFSSLNLRTRWLTVVATVFLALMWIQVRWLDFSAPAMVMLAGLSVRHWWPDKPWAGIIVIVLATSPPWFLAGKISRNVASIHEDSMKGPHAETFALRAASDCVGGEAKGSIMLAAWDQGAILAGLGDVRVIGSAYWSNPQGLTDTFELFTTPLPDRFKQLAFQRKVSFILIPSPERLERAVYLSFVGLYGKPPTRSEAFSAYIWQLARDQRLPTIRCEPLARIAPQWRIVQFTDSQ